MGDTTRNQTGSGGALDRAGTDLRATAAEAKSQAGDAASRVKDEAAGAYADVKAEAAGVADEVRERAAGFAGQQVNAGAEKAEGLARAVHRAADELQGNSPQLAQHVREAAAAVQQFARNMRGRGVGDLMGDVQGMARQQPAAFFGAAVLAGFALSRFLKSSAPGGHGGAQGQAHGGGYPALAGGTAAPSPSAGGGSSRVRVIPAVPRDHGTASGSTAPVVGSSTAPAAGSSIPPVVG